MVVDLGGHLGRHDEDTVRREDQNAVLRLVATLDLQLGRRLQQDFDVLAQQEANALVNVARHAATGHDGAGGGGAGVGQEALDWGVNALANQWARLMRTLHSGRSLDSPRFTYQ